jgi:putative glutathione S-transferase
MVRTLKGLEQVIGLSIVGHFLGENGWEFTEGEPGVIPDSVNNFRYLRELYLRAAPEYSGRFTVPVLWDCKRQTIVNNESAEIIRMLNSEFNAFAKRPELDLAPAELLAEIDEVNQWVYDGFNNGVYKAGFATKQEAYEMNCSLVFATMDRIEERLRDRKYLVGEQLTEADIRCFTTALRFGNW